MHVVCSPLHVLMIFILAFICSITVECMHLNLRKQLHFLYCVYVETCLAGKMMITQLRSSVTARGGGALTLEVGTGTCRPQDPLCLAKFQLRKLTFSKLFPAPDIPLGLFEKIQPFKTNFCRFLAPETQLFSKKLFRRPQFQAKNSVPETLFLKAWAAHTQMFGDYPLPGCD